MEDRIKLLDADINEAWQRLNLDKTTSELAALQSQSTEAGFWDDTQSAQSTMKQIAKLDNRLAPWQKLRDGIRELLELSGLHDTTLNREIETHLSELEASFNSLKNELKFKGQYDDHDAILSIYAGAGGTDAQDWTQMLFRMYSRFFEMKGWKTEVIDESTGDEAGLKSVTMQVDGKFAYGLLRGEHGVHRLVRLSPFNADHLRQTSFAKVEVVPKIDKPDELELNDQDLKIDVYRSGGHGGQSVNTTDSAVRVTHVPTGLTVAIQNERSQLQNKETALTILRSRLAQLQLEQHLDHVDTLKGPNQSAEWGNQIRSYVLHPYKQVKDLRTRFETSDPDKVLDGDIEPLVNAYLEYSLSANN
jgi:peptide chain release factor 2